MRRRSLVLVVLAIALIVVLATVTFGVGLSDLFSGSETGPGSTATPAARSPTSKSPTASPEPTSTPTIASTPTATPTRAPSVGYTDAEFYQALKDAGIAVSNAQFEQAAQDKGDLTKPFILEYTTETTTADARREEIGRIADIYARAVANGYQRTRLTAMAFNESGRPAADFHIERAWALAYAEGELSAEEYGQRIGQTMGATAPATPPQTIETPTPTRAPSEGYTDAEFRQALERAGINVNYLQPEEGEASESTSGAIVLEYTSYAGNETARRAEVGTIADVYAQAVANDYQRGPIETTAYDGADRFVANVTIQREWALDYAEGDLSAEEYGEQIGQTYRSAGTSTGEPTTQTQTEEESDTETETETDTETETETTDESQARRVREQVDTHQARNRHSDERVQGLSVL